MRSRLPHYLSAAFAVCALLPLTAQAQVIPFAGHFGQGLAASDNQMIFESVARLNAAEPSKPGLSDSWSNPETKSSGTSTILRVFHSGGMACHLVRHHIIAGSAAQSRLSPHLVPHSDRRMEDQRLSRARRESMRPVWPELGPAIR